MTGLLRPSSLEATSQPSKGDAPMIVAHVTRSTPPRVGLIRLVPQGTGPWHAIHRRATNQQPQTINH